MGSFGAFLVALAGPIARRVLFSLGLGIVSFAALSAIASQVKDAVISNYGQIPQSILPILDLLGAGQALGIILGGIIARAAFGALGHIGRTTA